MRSHVNVVIHNAWRLDFNLSLTSFESNIRGTQHLVEFARSAQNAPSLKFLFTSSVGSATSWDKAKGSYPEDVILDAKYAVGNGYGESKYVAERVNAFFYLESNPFTYLCRFWRKAAFNLLPCELAKLQVVYRTEPGQLPIGFPSWSNLAWNWAPSLLRLVIFHCSLCMPSHRPCLMSHSRLRSPNQR
jgi:hypothetical protein